MAPTNRLPSLILRLNRTFRNEERRGLILALRARTVVLAAVLIWLTVLWRAPTLPVPYTLAVLGTFLALGIAQGLLAGSRHDRPWHKYVFMGVDAFLLAAVLVYPNPLLAEPFPPAVSLRLENVLFLFVLLALTALSYTPRFVIFTGAAVATAWSAAVYWVYALPTSFTFADVPDPDSIGMEERLVYYLDPNFVDLSAWMMQIVVIVLVTGVIGVAVQRNRSLVERQVRVERQRANLARYFSPNVVEELAQSDKPLGDVRRQPVAVLFVDIIGFTGLCEGLAPEAVVRLLRQFHQRVQASVFEHGGTLDKYIGDGVMATFGTPRPGPRNATDALLCALRLVGTVRDWNAARQKDGDKPILIGIGVHYGDVVLGEIGTPQRREFTVIGDAVNVAARLERLTRNLRTPLVVSEETVQQAHLERAREAALPDMTQAFGAGPDQTLRGRTQAQRIQLLRKEGLDLVAD